MTDLGNARFARWVRALAVASALVASPALAAAPKLPDLLPTAITNPPAKVVAGQSFSVTVTIKNVGSAPAAASTTRFWLEDGTTRLPLNGVQSLPALIPGESKGPAATVVVPPGTPGGRYVVRACADDANEIPEGKEANNCDKRSAEEVEVAARPSLVVASLTGPPASARPGSSFTVTTTVKNMGALPATGSTTKFYLVSIASTLVELAATQSVPPLAAGSSFADDETLTIPADAALGVYRLQACADAAAAVEEDNEADNCRVAAGSVLVATQPDLVLDSVTLASAQVPVTPGGTITIGTTARNTGVSDAAPAVVTFTLVRTGSGAITSIVETQAVAALVPGASAASQTVVTVPAGTALGTYTATACIDAAGAIPEVSDGNNCATAAGTVSVQSVVRLEPDLVVTTLTNPPASGAPSESFVVNIAVKNQGVADSVPSTTSFTLIPTGSGKRKNVKGVYAVPPLASGATTTAAVTLTLYSDTLANTYRLQACADGPGVVLELVESNNCVVSSAAIAVQDPPDLAATAVSNPPPTVAQGQAIQATATIKNIGPVSAPETITRYYLVATDGSRKIDLSGKPPVPALDPGESFTEKDKVKVRPETVPGPYFLRACADSGKAVTEKNENNNCATSTAITTVTPRPDLVVKSVFLRDPTPVLVTLGGIVRVEFTVTNLGPGPAGTSQMRFFLVDQKTGRTKDLKGHPSVPSLDKTKSATVKGSVTVFSDTAKGTYTLRACADYNEAIPEADETNNCEMATGTVVVQ